MRAKEQEEPPLPKQEQGQSPTGQSVGVLVPSWKLPKHELTMRDNLTKQAMESSDQYLRKYKGAPPDQPPPEQPPSRSAQKVEGIKVRPCFGGGKGVRVIHLQWDAVSYANDTIYSV